MAYDPKDPADKKIVDKLIADAVAEIAGDEDHEAHEGAVKGLKAKNVELIKKNKELKDKSGETPDVAKLEDQIEKLQGDLKEANKATKAVTKERDTFKATAENETKASQNLYVENGLNAALIENNVGKQFMKAAKALLKDQVTIKVDGEIRTAMVGDKPLGEFVKTWSQGDEGKSFVVAPANGGGGAPGAQGKGNGTAKVIKLAEYNANPAAFAVELRTGAATLEQTAAN